MTCPGWKVWEAAPSEVVEFQPPAFARRFGRARVDYTVLYFNHHWDVERVTGRSTHSCLMEREPSGWRVESCVQSSSTED